MYDKDFFGLQSGLGVFSWVIRKLDQRISPRPVLKDVTTQRKENFGAVAEA